MKHRSLNIVLITCFTWLALSATSSAQAFFASTKNAGMGLTGAAYAQDALTAAFNPANATEICDRADLGFAWDHYSGRAIFSGNPVPGANGRFNGTTFRDFYAPDFGINKSFCLCDFQLAAGLVAYNRDILKIRYNRALPLVGVTPPGLELIREEISPYIAVKFDPNDWCDLGCYAGKHSIGVSVNILGQRLKVNGIENFILLSATPDSVTNREYNYSWGCGATIGWRGEWLDCFSLGVAYTPRAHMGRFKRYAGFLAHAGELQVPEKILAGLAFNCFPCTTVVFDVEFLAWNHVPALANQFAVPPAAPLGTPSGPGFGWRHQTNYHVGIDYQALDCLTLRAGYIYVAPLFKGTQVAVNLLTLETVENYITAGASYQMECFEFSLAYLHGFKRGTSGPIPLALGGGVSRVELVRDVVAFSIGYNY